MTASKTSLSEVFENTDEVTHRVRQAVHDALQGHKQASNPVAVWRDGKVVIVPPEEIPGAVGESEVADSGKKAG